MSARVTRLLHPESLGDKRPPEMLSYLKANLARNDVSVDMLRELLISRMPDEIKLCLCTMPDVRLDQLANAADRIMDNLIRPSVFASSEGTSFLSSKSNVSSAKKTSALAEKMNTLEKKIERLIQSSNSASRPQNSSWSNRQSYGNYRQNQVPPNLFNRPQHPYQDQDRHSASAQFCYYHRNYSNRANSCRPPRAWNDEGVQGNFRNPRR